MEVYNYELKSKLNDKFLKTVSSFANYNDGTIIFGLDNEGQPIGLDDLDDTKLMIENKINDSIKPRPKFNIDIDFEKNCIILKVFEGENKPYYYKNKAYKRSDSSDVEVDRDELSDLVLFGRNLDYEQITSLYQDLSFSYFNKEANIRMGISDPDLDLLKSFDLYSDDMGYNNAGLLISDKNNYKIIDFVKFGKSISDIDFRKEMKKLSILDAFNQMVEYYTQYYNHEIIVGKSREFIEKIPFKAFREAIANALVHRRWDRDAFISVSFYDDRIEISSPGGLPNGISEHEYLNRRVSSPRNPIISNIFFRFRYIDRLGTGIFRIQEAYKESASNPEFEISDNYVTVTLPVTQVISTENISIDARKIMNYLSDNNLLSRIELEELTGYNKDKVIRHLNELRDNGVVEVVGNGRGTKYKSRL